MATAAGFTPDSDEESLSRTESEGEEDDSDESDSDDFSEVESDDQVEQKKPCKFYNDGGCSRGNSCAYLHVCKDALKGKCSFGSKCKLNHSVEVSAQPASRDEDTRAPPKLTDGRKFQWQLYDGNQWLDIENDHVIEAQYSLPHTKSMKIYNTPYGAVSIDFNRIKVYGKNLKVRRLDDGHTVWNWYCTLKRKWKKYADKDSKGNPSPVKSSDIEREYQRNPRGSYTFSIGNENLEIRFKEMRQVGKSRKRKVIRRPVYRGARPSSSPSHSPNAKPQWQFEGDRGAWHNYKHRGGSSNECTANSDDIERTYQQNRSGNMSFRVNQQPYMLDFAAMKQTNLKTKKWRKIRRVMV